MLLHYLKDRRSVVLLLLVFTLIFTVVFTLSGLPASAALYGGLLCFVFLAIAGIYDFYSYYKKHKQLCKLKNNAIYGIHELPEADGLLEADYADLLREAAASYRGATSSADVDRAEMLDFYTLWVHQIKTPISAMSVLLQEDGQRADPRLLQELFQIERYTELVLSYLRIDSMSSDLQLEYCTLEKIVNQAVRKYAPLFIRKKLKLELQHLDREVLTDEKWLTFVVEQLLSNALKYTKTGGVRIYTQAPDLLVIEDTGIGIAREDLPRVFERGFTGFNGRMDQKATGLGLYLCRKTLDKLGHSVKIDSQPGRGTTVRIDLHTNPIHPE